MKIRHFSGNIAEQRVEAIVNAANETLLGGKGVDGAIHTAAGPKLLDECKALGGCAFGEAKITAGYNLPAKYVIHAVGPIYKEHSQHAPMLLASAYRRSLEIADEHKISSVAFPAISTGAYGYPMEEAAEIAVKTVREYANEHPDSAIEELRFVSFNAQAKKVYDRVLKRVK